MLRAVRDLADAQPLLLAPTRVLGCATPRGTACVLTVGPWREGALTMDHAAMNPAVAAGCAGQLLFALRWLHEHGVRHGDASFRNVLVGPAATAATRMTSAARGRMKARARAERGPRIKAI